MPLPNEAIREAIRIGEETLKIYQTSGYPKSKVAQRTSDDFYNQISLLKDELKEYQYPAYEISGQPGNRAYEALQIVRMIVEGKGDPAKYPTLLEKQRALLYEHIGELPPVNNPNQLSLFIQ